MIHPRYSYEDGGGANAVSWIGEKPYFLDEALFRDGESDKGDSAINLPFDLPSMKGLSV